MLPFFRDRFLRVFMQLLRLKYRRNRKNLTGSISRFDGRFKVMCFRLSVIGFYAFSCNTLRLKQRRNRNNLTGSISRFPHIFSNGNDRKEGKEDEEEEEEEEEYFVSSLRH